MSFSIDFKNVNLDSSTEEGQVNNLIMNMFSGLQYSDLTDDEKAMLARHGYDPEKIDSAE